MERQRLFRIGETAEIIAVAPRSEEHTSELQSRVDLVCRLLLEKKKSQELSMAGGTAPRPAEGRNGYRAGDLVRRIHGQWLAPVRWHHPRCHGACRGGTECRRR